MFVCLRFNCHDVVDSADVAKAAANAVLKQTIKEKRSAPVGFSPVSACWYLDRRPQMSEYFSMEAHRRA